MAEISVIVPVYRVEPFLHRCIDSVLNQTYSDFDLILIDDGSPDRCGSICDEYAQKDSRVHVIHQENGGLSAARNAGIERALKNNTCKWITFIDSDDWVSPLYLELLLHAVTVHKVDVAIVGCYFTNGEPLPEPADRSFTLWKPEDYYLKDALNTTVSWGKIYKKEIFKDICFPVGKIHEDEFVFYKILFRYKYIAVLEQPLYAYYQNAEGISKRKWSIKKLDYLYAFEQQIEFFLREGYEDIARFRFNALIRHNLKSQESIRQCDNLTEKEKKRYLRQTKGQLRKILIKYRKFKWSPFRDNEKNKAVYFDAFPILQAGRNGWGKMKPVLKSFPPAYFVGHNYMRVWRRRQAIPVILRYMEGVSTHKTILMQSPLHGNLGDHAIAKAELDVLKILNVSCMDFPWTAGIEKYCAMVTPHNRMILHQGGGNLGQLWTYEENRFRESLTAFHNHKIIVFPQTVYFDMNSEEGRKCYRDSKAVYESHPDLTLFVRERYSYAFMKKYMPNVRVEIVPDMGMLLEWDPGAVTRGGIARQGVLICMRKDKEKTISPEDYNRLLNALEDQYRLLKMTDTVLPEKINPDKRERALNDKLTEFSSASLVVTDRLHGMIFSAVTETPCIVINSLSHKIKGCYEWLKDLDYVRLVDNMEDLPTTIQELKEVRPVYKRAFIEQSMEPLYKVIRDSL